MNELTRGANGRESRRNMIPTWVSPALLAVIGLGTAGGYGQLSAINGNIEETNRLAELRGATSEAIATLNKEVDTLRLQVARMKTNADFDREMALVKSALSDTRNIVERKVDKAIFSEQMVSQRQLITAIANYQERLVTHEQLNLLVGRVDAISRKIGVERPSTGGVGR